MCYAVVHGRTDLWPLYEQTLAYVQSQFRDPEHGGWTPQPKSECTKDVCKHQADVGYHIVAMHVEAIKLGERQPHRP